MKKKTKVLWIVILSVLAFLIVVGATAAVMLPALLSSHSVNQPDQETDLTVPDPLTLYSGDNIGFSFLYPDGMEVAWDQKDGAYLYDGAKGSAPYVLIYRDNRGGMTPDRYFNETNQTMLRSFSDVQSTPIQEVVLGDKTLYLTRYQADGYIIDRYVELYPSCFIQYTVVSDSAGSLDTAVYYAASTLKLPPNAYEGCFSKTTTTYHHPDIDLQLQLPDMLDNRELTIGYFSSSDDAVMLTILCTQDDYGKPIYNRQDFIDRAAASPDFVAGLLGADTATFSGGSEVTYNGRSFYTYPMEMTTGTEKFAGTLCLANAPETGCVLVCYAANTASVTYESTVALLESCAESLVLGE